jgi:hypothetical protein
LVAVSSSLTVTPASSPSPWIDAPLHAPEAAMCASRTSRERDLQLLGDGDGGQRVLGVVAPLHPHRERSQVLAEPEGLDAPS